jgi:magnesium chelatase family protein
VAARVRAARAAQAERWRGTAWRVNSEVPGAQLRRGRWRLPASATVDLDRALDRGQLTLRGYDRVLRVGWTVADLGGRDTPVRDDLGTALTLRNQGPVAA